MGNYTEFHLNVKLHQSKEVEDALNYMLGKTKNKPNINHPLFDTNRWPVMLQGNSAYFNMRAASTLYKDELVLSIRTNFKNYDNEIEKFLDWIKPHLDCYSEDFLGYFRYESDVCPTLIYYHSAPNLESLIMRL